MRQKPPTIVKKPQIVPKEPAKKPTLQHSEKSEHIARREAEDETDLLSRLRSLLIFNHDVKDEMVRLVHTPDPLTGKERTSDYGLQLTG